LKVGASVGVRACGMNGTDEVWVAGQEETAIALRDFGHGGGVGVLVWVEFPKNSGVGSDRGNMIAAVEISQHLSSDCLQLKFPRLPHLLS